MTTKQDSDLKPPHSMNSNPPQSPGFRYRAEVLRVLDGDTLELSIDLGFHTFTKQICRLVGLNCPERDTDKGLAAKQYTEAFFASDKRCTVETVRDRREKYGRYLATVFDAGGRCLNVSLIENNLAATYLQWGSNESDTRMDPASLSRGAVPTVAHEG